MHAEDQPLAGRYALDHPLAAGGMAEVWRATDLVLGRPVAVKIIRPGLFAQPGFAQRFAAEARILAGLRHPGIVAVHDYGEADGSAYLVMEFIDGEPLSDRLARVQRLSAPETLAIVAQAADALQAAHEAGVVHRDIKPANLLVRPDGTVVVVDFGVAKAELSAGLTQTDTMLGTARYMAPEQVTGRAVTPATDLYALGAVAYECLAGEPPHDADTPLALALKHVTDEPQPLPDTVPARARAVVARAMAKDPAERFPDAAALAAAARAGSGPDSLTSTAQLPPMAFGPDEPTEPIRHPATSRSAAGRYAVIGGAGVVAAAIGAILLAVNLPFGGTPPSEPSPDTTPQTATSSTPQRQPSQAPAQGKPTANPAPSPSSAASSPEPSPSPSPAAPPPSPQPAATTPPTTSVTTSSPQPSS